VRVRFEDRSPAAWHVPWRAVTFVLAADDLYAVQSMRSEGTAPDEGTYQSQFDYDRHEGLPVLRSERTTMSTRGAARETSELKVVERRFGPIPEEEFDPDRFLEGPRVTVPQPPPFTDEPTMLARWYWAPLPVGAIGLIVGASISLGTRRERGRPAPLQSAS
jgi:hypothetical protein